MTNTITKQEIKNSTTSKFVAIGHPYNFTANVNGKLFEVYSDRKLFASYRDSDGRDVADYITSVDTKSEFVNAVYEYING